MNPAILFLLFSQTNGGRGFYSTVSSIDEPDDHDGCLSYSVSGPPDRFGIAIITIMLILAAGLIGYAIYVS